MGVPYLPLVPTKNAYLTHGTPTCTNAKLGSHQFHPSLVQRALGGGDDGDLSILHSDEVLRVPVEGGGFRCHVDVVRSQADDHRRTVARDHELFRPGWWWRGRRHKEEKTTTTPTPTHKKKNEQENKKISTRL